MNKLAVIVPFYKRKELTKLCFKELLRQKNKFGFDVYVCGDNEEIIPNEFKNVMCNNIPLGNKLNTLLKSTQIGNYDGVLIVGSDDFI